MRKSIEYKAIKKSILFILFFMIPIMMEGTDAFKEIIQIKNFYDFKLFLTHNYIFMIIIGFLLILLLALRLYSTKELDETDFEKNKNYYRDIIKNYSISVLNYIDNFTLDYKQSYTAKLLELQKNGIIEIKDNIITIINKPTKKLDIRFVESIINNRVTMTLEEYRLLVIDEAIEEELIIKNNKDDSIKIASIIIISMIVTIILLICGFIFAIMLIILEIPFVFVLMFIMDANNRIYKRTPKGKEINTKLNGLKLYMEHFTDMNNKKAEQLVLWEDYLICSVMFNINHKIQDEYSKYFEQEHF